MESDIYVSTSLSDGGLAASTAEAMACELPVIITNFGVNSKWISENYESKEGKMIGFAEYNWSHSIAIQLLLERYKEPLLP